MMWCGAIIDTLRDWCVKNLGFGSVTVDLYSYVKGYELRGYKVCSVSPNRFLPRLERLLERGGIPGSSIHYPRMTARDKV